MGTLLQDVRYGWRMLVNKPTFTIVAVLTLALGVGANTAIFSIVNAVLLRPLPYPDPDRLVRIFFNEPGVGLRDVRFSQPELDDLLTRAGVFEDVTPIFEGSENLTDRKSTRLNSSHSQISYAVFCLKKKRDPIGESVRPLENFREFALRVTTDLGDVAETHGVMKDIDPQVALPTDAAPFA